MNRVIGPKYMVAATAVTTNQAIAICQPGYQPAIVSSAGTTQLTAIVSSGH
jgi:hypothetical protein